MDRRLEWSLVQAFLAVAQAGSLSGAARRLGASQPTIGRQVQALEDQLGATLFERQPRGMALTDAGADLLASAHDMAEAAQKLTLRAAGLEDGLAGTVRLTASVFTAHYHLPAIVAEIRGQAPEIQIEVVATDETENLLFREADIAVRMYRPRQLDMVTRHLGDLELGLFATPDYLARHGTPQSPDDLIRHQLVGYDRHEDILRGMRELGYDVDRAFFGVRCDHHAVYHELMRSGLGIGFSQVCVASRDPDLVRVLPEMVLPRLPVWLTAHPSVRRHPRVARVWDALARGLDPVLLHA